MVRFPRNSAFFPKTALLGGRKARNFSGVFGERERVGGGIERSERIVGTGATLWSILGKYGKRVLQNITCEECVMSDRHPERKLARG